MVVWPSNIQEFAREYEETNFGAAISVGTFCQSAMALKQAGLRKFSGPFDWIFSNVGVVSHCIQDDFVKFLDRTQYLAFPDLAEGVSNTNLCAHKFYRDHYGLPVMFNHHAPIYDEEYNYFLRCVYRFRSAMKSDCPKLLLMLIHDTVLDGRYSLLVEALEKYRTEFLLLFLRFSCFACGEDNIANSMAISRLAPQVVAVDFPSSSPSNGVIFSSDVDNERLVSFLRLFNVDSTLLSEPTFVVSSEVFDGTVNFDESWYLAANPDVALAVRNGVFETGRQHYSLHGRREGRRPKA